MYLTIGFGTVVVLCSDRLLFTVCVTSNRFMLHARLCGIADLAKMRSAAEPCRQCTASDLEAAATATSAVAMML
jgi:hypothetical protein